MELGLLGTAVNLRMTLIRDGDEVMTLITYDSLV